eukprot:15437754-Alexandrium_andersonii.AAC.1
MSPNTCFGRWDPGKANNSSWHWWLNSVACSCTTRMRSTGTPPLPRHGCFAKNSREEFAMIADADSAVPTPEKAELHVQTLPVSDDANASKGINAASAMFCKVMLHHAIAASTVSTVREPHDAHPS